jgi:NCS1 family nucleobase:cation symporter-1
MTTPEILKVEQHGLDPVPVEERTKTWLDLFFMKAGMVMSLPVFLLGSLMVPSFSWTEFLFVLVAGNLVLILLFGAMGCLGVDYGIPAYVASRFSFGHPYGSWLPSLSIVFTMIGWFAITTELAGMAVNQALGELIGIDVITPLIVLVGLMCAVPAVMGFENIKWLSIVSVPLLLGLACWMLIEILSENSFWNLVSYTPTGETTFGTGVDWVIGALISGVFMAPDFSRYLRSRKDMYIAYFLCVFPFLFLTGIGAISKLATGDWNPINAVQQLGLGIPALIIIFFATWTTMDTALYSAGLAMTNIFTRFKRWQNTIFVSLIGTTLAVFRVTEYFRGFLLLLSNIFSPMIGILLCDYFLVRRGSISLDKAYRPEGIFHYNRGINWIAIISMAVGFLVARYTPEMYVSSLTAMGSSMLLYYFGMKLFHPNHFLRRTVLRKSF